MDDPETVEETMGWMGLSKSVIEDKRQSLGIDQSLTEAWNPNTS